MNRNLYLIILIGLLLVGITAACAMPFIPTPQPETETPAPPLSPTETATLTSTPTELVETATATPEFAPFCELGTASMPTPSECRIPIAEQSSIFCTRKVPYNLIFINEGATYEVLNEGFTCSDAGMKDGRQMVTCTGPMATAFRVKVCDLACAIPTVQAEITQCPQGYVYNNQQGCCSQELQAIDQNCELLTLKTKSCVVDCSLFTKKKNCEKNSYACEWNSANKTCQLRR
jgi:hypothetical protein